MRRGPVLMIIAGLFFTAMIALVKAARDDMGAIDLMFWRGLTATPLAGYMVVRGRPGGWRLHRPGLFALRGAFGFISVLGYFLAAHGLAVADLSLISKLQPVVVAVTAGVVLGEGVGRRTILSNVLGFTGCALILAPGLAAGLLFGVYALVATVASAFAHVCIRGLMRTDEPATVVFYFQLVAGLVALSIIAVDRGSAPQVPDSWSLWVMVVGIGSCATIGQLLMTRAYSLDRAAPVAAASYTAPLWALAIDFLVFGLTPKVWAIAGGALVIAAGLSLIRSANSALSA